MPLPQRFHARCFDPTRRWPGRLRAALDMQQWRVVTVESYDELLTPCGSAGASPSQNICSPALLLCFVPDANASEISRWWSTNRERVQPRSPLIIVASSATEPGLVSYWQELGAAAVLTTTLELPLVVQLAQRFAATPENRAADAEHPLSPFWQALPWSDALPKAGRAR